LNCCVACVATLVADMGFSAIPIWEEAQLRIWFK
jgi:hypothetical protein